MRAPNISFFHSAKPALVPGHYNKYQTAFTRLDLTVCLGVIIILGLLVFPILAGSKTRSEQVSCANNLRQIGVAYQSWGSSHDNGNPMRVLISNGGMVPMGAGASWVVYAFIANYLGSPQVLVCPSDNRLIAKDFNSTSIDGGFRHLNYRDNAVSYFVGLHADFNEPMSLLSGDRDIHITASPVSCSAGVNNAAGIYYLTDSQIGWNNKVHQQTGNILFTSGVVQQLGKQELFSALSFSTNYLGSGAMHLLIP